MRYHEIENWALAIIDRVESRQPIEDSRVELKANWPEDPKKAARQIAGHANAARGEPILWLLGVDENAGQVPGADSAEFSSWYARVRASFDELAPEPLSLNVPVGGVTVVALYFETDRAPYVVKNPQGGMVQREVPWRVATGVTSATRSQLLRLLSPLQKLPQVEIVGAVLIAKARKNQQGEIHLGWDINLALFLTQPAEQQTVLPSHRCDITFGIAGERPVGPLSGMEFRSDGSKNVSVSRSAVLIKGPGLFEIRYRILSKLERFSDDLFSRNAGIGLTLRPVNIELPISIDAELKSVSEGDTNKGKWVSGNYEFIK